jgi:hypothetical protein
MFYMAATVHPAGAIGADLFPRRNDHPGGYPDCRSDFSSHRKAVLWVLGLGRPLRSHRLIY